MASLDPFLTRNRAFADGGGHEGLTIRAMHDVYVITCLDPRTDPAAILGARGGEVMVVRNAGGRVTDEVLRELAYVGYVTERVFEAEGPLFEVAVIHHNQCGTRFLADPEFRSGFAERVGADPRSLADSAVVDASETVRIDVQRVRASALLPDRLSVSGHVYDVTTGLLSTVIPAAPLRRGS